MGTDDGGVVPPAERNGTPAARADAAGAAPGRAPDPQPGRQSLRRQILRLADRLLAAADEATAEPLTVTVERAGSRVTFASLPGELAAEPSGLAPLEAALYRALTREPKTAKALARLAGYKHGSHVYGALRALCRHRPPLAEHTPDGYRLPYW